MTKTIKKKRVFLLVLTERFLRIKKVKIKKIVKIVIFFFYI